MSAEHPGEGDTPTCCRSRDERARNEEDRSGDRSEVPVDVEQPVHEVERDSKRQRELRPRAVARPDDEPERRAGEEEKADDACLGEELQRQIVRFERRVEVRRAVALVRELEGARPRSCRPILLEASPGLIPPGPAEIRTRLGKTSGCVREL